MKDETIPHHSRGVQEFLARHEKDVTGVVHGFDRIRLQGSLRALYQPEIMSAYLQHADVMWKDFKTYVRGVTGRIRTAAETIALEAGRRVHYPRHPRRDSLRILGGPGSARAPADAEVGLPSNRGRLLSRI